MLLLRAHPRPLALGLVLGAVAMVGAGCGSSSGTSTGSSSITLGAEPAGTSTVAAAAVAPVTTTTTTAAGTPTSGPLSKEPKIVLPKGAAPTHLVIKDLITGTGAAVDSGATVTVNYVGELYKGGKIFDASWNRGMPATFPLSGVIPGWTQGLPGMKVGGRRELIIPSSLAYGATGSGSTIPPNAPLVFVIDMLATQG
jgi:peptidylprolyl isomerase